MFATLDLKQGTAPRTAQREDGTTSPRQRRNVVRRACDWCKLIRIKCDSHRPCSHCQQAGRECIMTGGKQFRSITEAVKEIDTLRAQVREFENTKKQWDNTKTEGSAPTILPRTSSLFDAPGGRAVSSASRNGVRLDSILYGIASLPFFLTRMRDCVLIPRQHPALDLDISICAGGSRHPPEATQAYLHMNFLPPAQEIHFLDLFWQSHYFSYPVLNEAIFRKEYKSLVDQTSPGEPRKSSPLVDIVLALCIQLGNFRLRQTRSPQPEDGSSPEYPCLAGFQYYQRCQDALDDTIDSPSITAVHSYIYSVVYLCEAGLLKRAQVLTGKAIMTSMMLGLHHEPPSTEPEPLREVSRRTWWCVYLLDAKLSMETGQPPMIDHSLPTCRLPSDLPETARWLAPHYPYDENCPTWLGFQTQTLRLLDAARVARTEFYTKYDSVVADDGYDSFAKNGNIREECAHVLTEQMKALDAWTQQVPKGYYVHRKDEGKPFLTDCAPLDLSPNRNVLIHCQRQRLLLELQYHFYCMCLYRPFICFTSTCEEPTPLSDSKAVDSLNHAMALTSMIHAGLTSSAALFGHYDVFRWQKDALFTMIGFAYTFPVSHSTTNIQRSIELAITDLALFCDTLPEASALVIKARQLAENVDSVINGFYSTSGWTSSNVSSASHTPPNQQLPTEGLPLAMDFAMSSGQDPSMLPAMKSMATPSPIPNNELMVDLDFLFESGNMNNSTWDTMDELWSRLGDSDGGVHMDPWSTGQ
ncbi:fungal-specific transcription factor domain-containing protein [Xylariaceae sp. FL0594]|nr:fungal-specific transcription factor domain-containing protein [Xylariaceae sp. FL0594]